MRQLLFVALCASLPVAAAAQAYRAENWLLVVPLNATDFEVIEDHGEGARGMWCAAASFAEERLGQGSGQRLYVKRPRGRSVSGAGSIGVTFTTSEAGLGVPPIQSYGVTVRDAGLNLPVHHARQFCVNYLIDIEDL